MAKARGFMGNTFGLGRNALRAVHGPSYIPMPEGRGFTMDLDNFSCRRVNVLFLWCYVLTHKFSFHCEKDCLRSPDCEKTGQLATRKRYASERAFFRPLTAQLPVKIYRSNAK